MKINVPIQINLSDLDAMIAGRDACKYTDAELASAIAVVNFVEKFMSKTGLCSCTTTYLRQELETLKCFKTAREKHL